jgi:NADPH:quinone reductase-like Zn-dependent oxidoreductase
MKAAVIHSFGQTPRVEEFPNPIAGQGETLIEVKASVLENFDKLTVSGKHYSSAHLFPAFPAIVGTDGIGTTEDGRLVGFGNMRPPYGSFAQWAVAGFTVPIPEGVDPAQAAAMPASILTSMLPLKYSAELQPGETVLINGATGVSGRIAVQVTKLLGADNIIGTGRNANSLELLIQLGATGVIDLNQPEETLKKQYSAIAPTVDVIIDFLWGHPAELLLSAFIPTYAGFPKKIVRYIQVGESAGSHINIPASILRTSGLAMLGAAPLNMDILTQEMVQVWNDIKEGKFYMDIERIPLSDIASAWVRTDLAGKRLVIMP